MKYTVTYSCGHNAEVQLYGSNAEREREIAYFETRGLCPECYAAQKSADASAALESIVAELGPLPALTGSEKQVAWASKIRSAALSELLDWLTTSIKPEQRDIGKACISAFAQANTDASWWIDRRDNNGLEWRVAMRPYIKR